MSISIEDSKTLLLQRAYMICGICEMSAKEGETLENWMLLLLVENSTSFAKTIEVGGV